MPSHHRMMIDVYSHVRVRVPVRVGLVTVFKFVLKTVATCGLSLEIT